MDPQDITQWTPFKVLESFVRKTYWNQAIAALCSGFSAYCAYVFIFQFGGWMDYFIAVIQFVGMASGCNLFLSSARTRAALQSLIRAKIDAGHTR